ncbi:ribonuclease T [Caulobacter segnis]|uniref:Ribonuclease T2 n=2 Tax=Caulobacter segnis TaxID=88688 RepID=D5VDM2_CAUST|nr:ribonuclease T(2) [Caulobacter segnis]ADG08572.1 ribonuclease T2 [Caulobacter segnis ATCC 21756]AVQ00423.1 ribonuclease T [Caulobacter segnis]
MKIALVAAVASLALAGTANASDLKSCAVPISVTPSPSEVPPPNEIHTDVPIAAYLLALYWSPEACRAGIPESDKAIQCQANSFGFTVHGLWPNGPDRVHPRYCRPSPPMSPATVKANLCMTPSPWLLQHEWQAHGTCQWDTPEAYFKKARKIREKLNVPDLDPGADGIMTAGEVRKAFIDRNGKLSPEGLNVRVKDGRLTEVWVCMDLKFKWAACRGGNGAPDMAVVKVTPKRG